MAKFHRTDLVIFSHSTEGKTLSYSRINMVWANMHKHFMGTGGSRTVPLTNAIRFFFLLHHSYISLTGNEISIPICYIDYGSWVCMLVWDTLEKEIFHARFNQQLLKL